jgi:hypothetical protein
VTEDTSQAPKDIIGFLDFYLVKKAPFQIPDGAREWIVKFGPWITLVLLVISLPFILALLGIGTFLVPFGGLGYATGFGMAALFLVICVGLEIFALPGLFARKMSGWTLMFYAQIASAVGSLLGGSIVSGLVGAVISLYILFQVRSLYKA